MKSIITFLHLPFVLFNNQNGIKQKLFTFLLLWVTVASFAKPINETPNTRTFVGVPFFESSNSAVLEEGTLTTTTILDVNATDGDGGVADADVTYTISGTDALDFNIDTNSGAITFAAVPNYYSPADADTDNIYKITVTATDVDGTKTQDITIYVFLKNGLVGSGMSQQLGADINGEALGDTSGGSVSFSADGKTLAIGAIKNDGAGTDAGHVRIYKYNGSAWAQAGADIDGGASQELGFSVSLSADGNTVAIGSPSNNAAGINAGQVMVYKYISSSWQQASAPINGQANDLLGSSVSLSADGNFLAIGAKGAVIGTGYVVVFYYDGSDWALLGREINGVTAGEASGAAISFSADGKTIAIGAPSNNEAATNAGQVRIYQLNGLTWTQKGSDINGPPDANALYGAAVSLSADGNTVAISVPGAGADTGGVEVLQYNGSNWSSVGQVILGEVSGEKSGASISLSADGKIIAIGATLKDISGTDAGQVRIYYYNGSAWVKVGADIDGENAGDNSGYAVSISADGTKVAIGAPNNDGNGADAGHVRIYELYNLPRYESLSTSAVVEGTAITTTALDVNVIERHRGVADTNITYAISGTDASDFNIDTNSGAITFAIIPDLLNPVDADTNNIYEFVVTATSVYGATNQEVKIYVFAKNKVDDDNSEKDFVLIGTGIDGEAADDQSGTSVSYSADGNTLAIGASSNDGNGVNAGHVRIYKYNGNAWIQAGADIDGEAAGDYSGSSVSLSADGNIIAIGAPNNDGNGDSAGHVRIYKYNGSSWTQVGADIDGENIDDNFGITVSLSTDGNTIAIGANDASRLGYVKAYEYNGSAWVQLGAVINGERTSGYAFQVSLSAGGNKLLIGGSGTVVAKVYKYSNNAWTQLGNDLFCGADNPFCYNISSYGFGSSVSISADGNTAAIGASKGQGFVEVYRYNGSVWSIFGSQVRISGNNPDDFFGRSISLNADGNILAIGAPTLYNNGYVQIYKYNGSRYAQVLSDIDGEVVGDVTGNSVSLSADGTKVAISAHYSGGNGSRSGQVRVYGIFDFPVFQSSNNAAVEENTPISTTVLDVNATNGAENADVNITYTLAGTDALDFNIDVNTGIITFVAIPVSNTPADADTNNFYEFTVTANNGRITKSQVIKVYVFTKNKITGTEISKQFGLDIDGEAAGDLSGSSVSLSADGSMLAIGAPENLGFARRIQGGHVRIYKHNGAAWEQLGTDINGYLNSGTSVNFSADGKVVAVGTLTGNTRDSGDTSIYKYDGSAWVQVGTKIDRENTSDPGSSVGLSLDGNTVAIGIRGNDGNGVDAGHVKIYRFNGIAWVQLGIDIDGENAGDESGTSIGFSPDGNTVAIGAPLNDGSGIDAGHVRIYNYNGTDWVQTGADIDGESAGDKFGAAVRISADGNNVVVGAPFNDANAAADSGQAKIYNYNGSAWVQVGSAIEGELAGDQFGSSVTINADGSVIAIGGTKNDGSASDSGHVRIYKYNDSAWAQVGVDIDGETAEDNSGYSVSLSADGSKLAIGAINNDATGANAGHVRVYELLNLPVFENSTPSADLVAETSFTLHTDIDIAGTIYYVVVSNGATAPTSAEVKAGTGNGGAGEITSGNILVNSGAFSNNFNITGLTIGTTYDVYAVAEDTRAAPNLQLNPTKIMVAAISKRWTGGTGTNWIEANNWSPNAIPLASDNLIIPNVGNKPNIESGTIALANHITIDATASLTINSGASLTMDGNLIQNGSFTIDADATSNGSLIVKGIATGNVTYKRYLTNTNWHLVGAPVNGQSINALSSSFLTSASYKKSIAPYKNDEVSASRWKYYNTTTITTAGNFIKGKGYSVKKATAGTLDFTGTLNTNPNETISIIDGGDNPTGNRWNLISNPYTAAIKGGNSTDNTNSFLKINIVANTLDLNRAGMFIWNGTTYLEKSLDDDFFIAPGQAFFVHAPDSGGTSATFTQVMQEHQTGNIFLKSSATYPEIIVQITDNTNTSSTKIRYIQNKTTGLDVGSDIGTFTGTASNLKVFTHLVSDSEGVNFAIQALPNSNYENMVVPIGVNAESGKEIKFSLNASNFDTSLKISLEDRLTNTFTRLDVVNSDYTVALTETLNGIGRFYIHTTQSSLTIKNAFLENVSLYKINANTIRITGLQKSKTNIKIFNIIGKKVLNTSFTSNGVKDIILPKFALGVYVVKLQTEKGTLNKKIILE